MAGDAGAAFPFRDSNKRAHATTDSRIWLGFTAARVNSPGRGTQLLRREHSVRTLGCYGAGLDAWEPAAPFAESGAGGVAGPGLCGRSGPRPPPGAVSSPLRFG